MEAQAENRLVHYELHQNCLVIYVTDDLDHHTVLRLREYSDRLIEAGNMKHIIFDFTDVGFMDSSGIGVIMGRYRKVYMLGGEICAVHVGERMKKILTMSGVTKIMQIYEEDN